MRPLIDADILAHELGWSGQFIDPDTEEEVILKFDRVADLLDQKIMLICRDVEADEEPTLFVTNSQEITNRVNRLRKFRKEPLLEFKPNFRYELAKTKPYKGTRKNPKPFHFYNILAHMEANYDLRIVEEGIEADDAIGIEQMKSENTIICSRDKDLRMIPGDHFSWECGGQTAIGPITTDDLGWLDLVLKDVTRNGKPAKEKKITGYGQKFFYFQMLAGDTVDNIPGLPGVGVVKAYDLINEVESIEEAYAVVKKAYIEKLGESVETKEYLFEQAGLLWIRREDKPWAPPLKKENK